MESDQNPVEPAHPRRKPRARAPKTQRLEEAPAYKEIAQQDVILDLSSASGVPQAPEVSPRLDFALPILAVAFVLFLVSQVVALRQNAASLAWQSLKLNLQAESLQGDRDNVAKLVQERQVLVDQSQRVTSSYNELLNDLIKLAETDKDARAVVEKFHIKSAGSAQPPVVPQQ
jgi:hypothetical protein